MCLFFHSPFYNLRMLQPHLHCLGSFGAQGNLASSHVSLLFSLLGQTYKHCFFFCFFFKIRPDQNQTAHKLLNKRLLMTYSWQLSSLAVLSSMRCTCVSFLLIVYLIVSINLIISKNLGVTLCAPAWSKVTYTM